MSASSILGGIYPPLPTFFRPDEALDLDTLHAHILRLQERGITGFVALGSNGEAVHLDDEERRRVISTARGAAGPTGQVLAGAGAPSTRATIALCSLAADSGADAALVLPPHYYRSQMNALALRTHFRAVADASPVPLILYNMPANAAGVDLDAETVIALSMHPNIIGVKDSSGNVAKLAEVVAGSPAGFAVLAGSADFLLPALVIGAVGAISALANVAPAECLKLQRLYEAGDLSAARALQARLIPVNRAITSLHGIAGLKAALQITADYGGDPRRPLMPLDDDARARLRSLLAEADLLNALRPA